MKKHILILALPLCAGALFAQYNTPPHPKPGQVVNGNGEYVDPPAAAVDKIVAAAAADAAVITKERDEANKKVAELTQQLGQAITQMTSIRQQRDQLASSLLDATNTINALTAERDALRAAAAKK